MDFVVRIGVCVGVFTVVSATSFGQWTPTLVGQWVSNYYSYSSLNFVSPEGIGGYANPDGADSFHAMFCPTGQSSLQDIGPNWLYESYMQASAGGHQYGYGMTLDGHYHAIDWQGTAASAVDIHPGGIWSDSRIFGAFGDDKVGICSTDFSSGFHSAYWKGSMSNFIDLSPAGANGSQPYAVGANSQVGTVQWSDYLNHACVWYGSAGSVVDLHPSWANQSYATRVAGDMQGGNSQVFGQPYGRATLWRGSAGSAVDLTGAGFNGSYLVDMNNDFQVGSEITGTTINPRSHAFVWQGSTESGIDLTSSLYSIFSTVDSCGTIGILSNNDILGIASTPDGNFLVRWTNAVPEPASAVVLGLGLVAFARHRRPRN